jgi:RNA polymerase sigma factor (sigma-70 family)
MPHRTDVDRSITASRLARLLARLHPDAEQAAQEYERLRRTLVRFFHWRGALSPEECADDTLDRLARKLEETTVDDMRSYAHAVARLVLLERRRGPVFSSIEESPHLAIVPDPASDDADERLRDCFDSCLDGISEDARAVLLAYYEGEREAKISNRRRLATSLGVSENALRSRVQRLRDRLERCVDSCVSAKK